MEDFENQSSCSGFSQVSLFYFLTSFEVLVKDISLE